MPITEKQDIPNKPVEPSQAWTAKKLFPFASMASAITKTFISSSDIILGFLVFVIGLSELFGRRVSLLLYFLALLVLIASMLERHIEDLKKKE